MTSLLDNPLLQVFFDFVNGNTFVIVQLRKPALYTGDKIEAFTYTFPVGVIGKLINSFQSDFFYTHSCIKA